MSFNLMDNYEQVDVRLKRFLEEHKNYNVTINTEMVPVPANLKGIMFKATIEVTDKEGVVKLHSTGWANEVPGEGTVNKDSVVENCETSAVGRALANLGFHGSKRPSQEEMKKVGSNVYAPAQSSNQLPTEHPKRGGSEYVPTFGKFKDVPLSRIPADQIISYCQFLNKDPSKLSQGAKIFIAEARKEIEKRETEANNENGIDADQQ